MSLETPTATAGWWPDTMNPLDAALAYHNAGLCVIPLNGKRPALGGWKHYQSQRPTEADIRRWAGEDLLQNLGIVCGKVSGNLVVLDFDGLAAYAAFAALFPTLAQSFTVATGSGQGKHVYLYVESLPPTTRALDTPIGHIELRSDGTYVAAAPSIHPITGKRYLVEKPVDIRRVDECDELVAWIETFKAGEKPRQSWRPPRNAPPPNGSINPDLIGAIADTLRQRRHKERGAWINCSCPNTSGHKNDDRNPSFGFNTESGYGHCYVCGSMLARDLCDMLGISPDNHGGLITKAVAPLTVKNQPPLPVIAPPAPPLLPDPPDLRELELPNWLKAYVSWASEVGSQTPETFHLGMGIWMAAVAIARRVYADAPWGLRIFPNLYMMFIAGTTFYRKTTAYKLGERILTTAIPHLQMPTPGSPERFQDALAGHAPSNFSQLPQEHQKLVLEAQKFAAQRGLFKDEIGGLFGAFKRDYMSGMKDFILEIYDCPDYIAKETQAGLAIIRHAAPSILGVTTPAGLSGAVSHADWDNGLLPRFVLLTPEPDYRERPGLKKPTAPPLEVIKGLRAVYDALPMPEQEGDGWKSAHALPMEVSAWEAVQAYSNTLRQQCDPRRETPLDDRLKGVYGRMHVQAVKVAEICATLDWVEAGAEGSLTLGQRHWELGKTIAEHWRLSAHRLLEDLNVNVLAQRSRQTEDRMLMLFQQAGSEGIRLRDVYRKLKLEAAAARQTALELVRAGLLVETRIGSAEAYALASAPEGQR